MQSIETSREEPKVSFDARGFIGAAFKVIYVNGSGHLRKPMFAQQKQAIDLHPRSARRNARQRTSTSNFRVSAGLSGDPV